MGTITVNRAELGKALDFAALGLPRRTVAPVLAGMLVTVSAGTLELATFDYETAAIAAASGQADGPGRVLVSGAELAAVVKSLPRGKKVTAELAAYDDGLILLCDGIESVLSPLPLDEYPQLPELPELSGVVDAEAFARSVARVVPCTSGDETLPVLGGVKFTGDAGELEVAGFDRYRLAVDRLHWTGPDEAEANIPARMLSDFARKADKTGKIALHFGEHHAALSDGTRTLITRSIPGEYPKYGRILSDLGAAKTTALVDAATLAAAVTRAGKLVDYRGAPVLLDVTDAGVTVRVMRDGEVSDSQDVDAVLDGDPINAAFNPGYLASILAGVAGEALIGFASPTKPVRVTSADESDGYTGVCMPVRLNA